MKLLTKLNFQALCAIFCSIAFFSGVQSIASATQPYVEEVCIEEDQEQIQSSFYGAIDRIEGNCVIISRCPDFVEIYATDNIGLIRYRTYYFTLGASGTPTKCRPIVSAVEAQCIWY
jgi:hypothetical protein